MVHVRLDEVNFLMIDEALLKYIPDFFPRLRTR